MRSRRRSLVHPLSAEEIEDIYLIADEFLQARPSTNRNVSRLILKCWAVGKIPTKTARDITLTDEHFSCLMTLAKTLQRIRDGEDARLIFRQNERKKPSKANEYLAGATIYWAARAANPAARDVLA